MAKTQLSVTIQDTAGVKATQNIDLNVTGTASFDGIGDAFNDYLPLLDAVTDGVIIQARLIWNLDLPSGLKTTPANKTLVSRGLLQSWIQDVLPTTNPSTLVPAVAAALIDATTGKFIVSNTAFLAWRAFLLGLNGGDMQFVSPAFNQIVRSLSVVESIRKHRKRTAELTTEEDES